MPLSEMAFRGMNPEEYANLAAAEDHMWWFRGMRRILFNLLDPLARSRPIKTVIEAGCGTGHMAAQLTRRYGWRVHPVDLSPDAVRYARRTGAPHPTLCDISSMPFPEACCDVIISLDVLAHFEKGREDRAVAEFFRVLKPGGLAVVRVAALDLLRSGHSAFVDERQRFTRARLRRAFLGSGFRPLRATYANSFLLPVALLKFRVWEPLAGGPPASAVKPPAPWLDRLLYTPLACEAALIRAGVNLPAGQSVFIVARKPG